MSSAVSSATNLIALCRWKVRRKSISHNEKVYGRAHQCWKGVLGDEIAISRLTSRQSLMSLDVIKFSFDSFELWCLSSNWNKSSRRKSDRQKVLACTPCRVIRNNIIVIKFYFISNYLLFPQRTFSVRSEILCTDGFPIVFLFIFLTFTFLMSTISILSLFTMLNNSQLFHKNLWNFYSTVS